MLFISMPWLSMENQTLRLNVSDFIALTNQTLEYAYPSVEIEGEVASFKVNQAKFVFFDIKDASGSLGCFMTVWQMRTPIEDGMKVIVTATPKLTDWGKFSLTVRAIRPSGQGSLKKSFELLKAKLANEGLFSMDRKRSLPKLPQRIAVIASTQSAGYADFIKITNQRIGGLDIEVAHVQVQGAAAPAQIIRALEHFNQQEELRQAVVLIRGGGSADDLSAFNDEPLTRAVAASRIPVITGIGHEIDESLVDLVADVRASTPSNAAELLLPDKRELITASRYLVSALLPKFEHSIETWRLDAAERISYAAQRLDDRLQDYEQSLAGLRSVVDQVNPQKVLARGYALIRGEVKKGATIDIERIDDTVKAEVIDVKKR